MIEGTGRFKLWGILKTTTKMIETFEEEDGSGNGEVRQSIELFKDYLKMVDGRKKRQTESEKARLMLAWMILKRRHEKRQRTTTDMERETASPPRMKKMATPRSPTNPAEELRQTRQQLSPSSQFKGIKQEEFYNQLKCMCLRRRKSNLERWFHSVKVQDHRVRFQPVIDELMNQSQDLSVFDKPSVNEISHSASFTPNISQRNITTFVSIDEFIPTNYLLLIKDFKKISD